MQIWPAIDLLGGQCVRLRQGDYNRETVFSDDPVSIARTFQQRGASHLHLVDLDGAREGQPVNAHVVEQIVQAVDMECELGGGIRDREAIEAWLDVGVSRLVLGTSALKEGDWFREMCDEFPNRLVLGLDARDGRVATNGWLETSDVNAVELAREFEKVPLAAIIYTDIATDGMMQGPNVSAMAQMQQAVQTPVIASGGVTSVSDVTALAQAKLAGVIIGRALYEGTIDLQAAIEASSNSSEVAS